MFDLLLVTLAMAQAQPDEGLNEVRELLDSEQRAFFAGDCETTVTHWAPQFTMVVEGQPRATDRAGLLGLCRRVMKMVADGRIPSGANAPEAIDRQIYMLGDGIAYEVTQRLTPMGDRSSVTKVVMRGPEGWQIRHMHEAIAKADADADADADAE